MIIASHVRHALNIIGLGTFIIGLGIFFPIIAPRFGLTLGISKDPEIIFYPPPIFLERWTDINLHIRTISGLKCTIGHIFPLFENVSV